MDSRDKGMIKAVAACIKEQVGKSHEVLRDRLRELDARIEALEKGGGLADHYKGSFDQGVLYRRGDLLTADGALWICLAESMDKPGKSAAYRLVVKGPGR
jgi:hypothetical protein